MKLNLPLITLTTIPTASAWTYQRSQGFGTSPSTLNNDTESALFRSAARTPNASATTDFTLGAIPLTLGVNVTEFTPTGADTDVRNPRLVNTVYSLSWRGSASLAATLRDGQNLAPGEDNPRLCATIPLGRLYSASATNGYAGDGDCAGPLGRDCVDAIENHGYGADVPCSPFSLPDACLSSFPPGGIGTASLLDNASSVANPYGFAFYSSEIYSAGNESVFERAAERLHVVVFNGLRSKVVCARVRDNEVQNGDPAVSESLATRVLELSWSLFGALSAAGWLLW
ncbi:hypothetical protein MBLNU230_g4161t1 [Neophaeotheca triangularis]